MLEDVRNTAAAIREAARELRMLNVPVAASRLSDQDLAFIAARLGLYWAGWVDRREIVVEFVEDATLRLTSHVSFQFPGPEVIGLEVTEGALLYVPLELSAKRTLLNLQISDEDGRALSAVPTARNGQLAALGLAQLLAADRQVVDPHVHEALRRVCGPPPAEGVAADDLEQAFAAAMHAAASKRSHPGRPSAEESYVRALRSSFLHMVQIAYEPGRSRRLAVSYDVPFRWVNPDTGLVGRAAVELGALPRNRIVDPFAIGHATSTHVEFVAPEEIDVLGASLLGYQFDPVTGSGRDLSLDAQRFERSKERVRLHVNLLAAVNAPADADPEARLRHLAEGAEDTAELSVSLFPRRSGTIAAAVLTSVLNAALLVVFAFRLRELDGQTSAALLLLLPAVGAAYLGRPGEHRFLAQVLRWPRWLTVLSASLGVVLAALIAGGLLTTGAAVTTTRVRATARTAPSEPGGCVATGRLNVSGRPSSVRVPLTVRCNPGAVTSTTVYKPQEEDNRKVPRSIKWLAWLLAAGSLLIALPLAAAWLFGSIASKVDD